MCAVVHDLSHLLFNNNHRSVLPYYCSPVTLWLRSVVFIPNSATELDTEDYVFANDPLQSHTGRLCFLHKSLYIT